MMMLLYGGVKETELCGARDVVYLDGGAVVLLMDPSKF